MASNSIYSYTTAKGETRYRIVFRDAAHKQTSRRGFTTQKDAKAALAKLQTSVNEGDYVKKSKGLKKVSELAPAWLETKKATLKESSYAALNASWRTHVEPEWADKPVGKIRADSVQTWINGIDRSPTTKRRAVEVLASILDTAVPALIRENPARGVKLPSKKALRRHRYLTHQQLWKVAEASESNKLKVLVLGYCGIRWGELTALRVESMDPDKQVLHIERNVVAIGSRLVEGTPKLHKIRRVPVPSRVWELLEAACAGRDPQELIFPNEYGTFISPPSGGRSGRNWWVAAQKKAGLPYMVIHDLRHTAASLAVRSGAHVKIVQRMLGHASAAITLDTYADLFEDDLDVLIERLDSDIDDAIVASSVATKPTKQK